MKFLKRFKNWFWNNNLTILFTLKLLVTAIVSTFVCMICFYPEKWVKMQENSYQVVNVRYLNNNLCDFKLEGNKTSFVWLNRLPCNKFKIGDKL